MNKQWMWVGVMAAATVAMQAQVTAPAAPTPQADAARAANPFPKVNPKNFTATTPTTAEVDGFLKTLWGYEPNRIWQVAAILKTTAPGVAKVVVFAADKTGATKGQTLVFFVTPDGKHAISDSVVPFGANPYVETRKMLREGANGPTKGAKSDEFEIVEFTDLQCPRCKEQQETMENLMRDFPQAKFVIEPLPLTEVHPYAYRAAAEGVCVRLQKGDAGYFAYAQEVFAHQSALTPETVDATLDAAVKAAGVDPAAMAACATTAPAKTEVDAGLKLAGEVGADSTPSLFVNGRPLALTGVPYDVLKRMIQWQAGLDGIKVEIQPTLNTLK